MIRIPDQATRYATVVRQSADIARKIREKAAEEGDAIDEDIARVRRTDARRAIFGKPGVCWYWLMNRRQWPYQPCGRCWRCREQK